MSVKQSASRVRSRSVPLAIASAIVVVVAAATFFITSATGAGWLNEAAWWVHSTQRELHGQLTLAMVVDSDGRVKAFWSLVGVSLLYGIFHAAGPGHGKAVITTYLGSNAVLLSRGVTLSFLGALLQGFTAVFIMEVGSRLLGLSMAQVHGLGASLENISFAFVSLLGGVILFRGLMLLYHTWPSSCLDRPPEAVQSLASPTKGSLFSSGGKMKPYCETCGVAHGPGRHQIEQPLKVRHSAIIVLSIGLRPCTGALLVLGVSYALGVKAAGICAVLAMSLGTAAAVSGLATATTYARNGLLRLFGRISGYSSAATWFFALARIGGGIFLLVLGASLLSHGLNSTVHPLLMISS